jgi:hypothetical protein
MRKNIHALSGIRINDPQCSSERRRHALDRAATVIGYGNYRVFQSAGRLYINSHES